MTTTRLARIPLSSVSKIAIGIERPEDVVVGKDGRIFASDHLSAVAEIHADGSFTRMGPRGGAPNGINMDAQGRIIIANFGVFDGEPGPLQRFDPATAMHETLLSEVEGRPLTASNYPVIDSAGNIWCANSTSAPAWPDALDGRADGFLYVLRADGSSAIVADGLKFPNGLALSEDERFLFCAQTTGGDVLRFPVLASARLGPAKRYGPKLGVVANRKMNPKARPPRWLTRFLGYTDGIGFDVDGNLWVTLVAAHKIVAITPQGRKYTILHDPEGDLLNSPTNITWGGEDMRDVYIGTIARNYVLKTRSPVPGQRMIHQR